MHRSCVSVCIGALVLGSLAGVDGRTVLAQDATPLAFEVASVKPSSEPVIPRGIEVSPGRFTSADMPIMPLIVRAYGFARWRIEDAPGWVNSERFNVQAIFPPSSTPAQVNAMLRTLLEQRFRLSVQLDTREMDTDALILANRDRSLGSGMHPVDVDCDTNELREGSAPGLFASMKLRPPCGSVMITAAFNSADPRSMRRTGATRYAATTMTQLADSLSGSWARPVLDRTGLPGQFDVELEYASSEVPSAMPGVAATPGGPPALPEALRQQLGLELRRERNRVEVMIIRSIERPRVEEN